MDDNGQLRQYVERIEKLQEEISELQADIRQVFAEAKGNGFSAKGIKEVIKAKKMNPADFAEEDFLRTQYLQMMGLKGK